MESLLKPRRSAKYKRNWGLGLNQKRKLTDKDMEGAFAGASAITDQRQKIEQYKHILSSVFSSNDIVQSKKFIDHSRFSFNCFFFILLISYGLTLLLKNDM